ncbi:hypothetical protein EVAR_3534_1 [Eumeta japonica]|uniref:Mos1 transposase HTH domain-containing protein n=1 Tax=Eumeta variegata TaxID=151549 RepID=A0A4C1SW58_EUMVA|nr:hypothetical protein EVAR_3534_1 [Eumeta japonica]
MTFVAISANKQESYYRLRLAFHDKPLSFASVYNWFCEFKRGHTNLTDDLRKGRSSSTTKDNISAVRLMKENKKRVTWQKIWTGLDENIPYQRLNVLLDAGIEPGTPSPKALISIKNQQRNPNKMQTLFLAGTDHYGPRRLKRVQTIISVVVKLKKVYPVYASRG